MKLHKVTKVIDFCYGHRLLKYDGKCKNLHGHNGVLEIDISSNIKHKNCMKTIDTLVNRRYVHIICLPDPA